MNPLVGGGVNPPLPCRSDHLRSATQGAFNPRAELYSVVLLYHRAFTPGHLQFNNSSAASGVEVAAALRRHMTG